MDEYVVHFHDLAIQNGDLPYAKATLNDQTVQLLEAGDIMGLGAAAFFGLNTCAIHGILDDHG